MLLYLKSNLPGLRLADFGIAGSLPQRRSALKVSRLSLVRRLNYRKCVGGTPHYGKRILNNIAGLTESVADYTLNSAIGVLVALIRPGPSWGRYKGLV